LLLIAIQVIVKISIFVSPKLNIIE